MKKRLKQRLQNEKGLTLVELLAVIVILGIIAAIAIPAIGNIITNSKVNALKADGQNVLAAGNLYFVENNKKATVSMAELTADGFLEDAGGFAATTGAVAATITKGAAGKGNTISGTAANGTVTVAFTTATNADITAADVKASTGKVIVTR